jgi:glycosyltransferase involved in cell wall biosynthesis
MVEVLLATYNGERFLRAQIDSILRQDYGRICILASDDGSTDGTVAILEDYAAQHAERFAVMTNQTATGHPKRNFLRLLKASTAPYVCFADQDDVWTEDKVRISMEAMRELEAKSGESTPALIFTDLRVVDESLRILVASHWKKNRVRPQRAANLARLICQNIANGCTELMNRPLVEMALRMPEEAEMHDHWVALLAAAFGVSRGLPVQTVLYRQHSSNVLGADRGRTGDAGSADPWRRRRRNSEAQAAALLRVHGAEMSPEKRRILEVYLRSGSSESRLERIILTVRNGFYVLGIRSNLAMLRFLWNSDLGRKMPGC